MKDSSSPMDVCPFCGKAFKRLKSHLPHCKMAETKKMTPETDYRDQSMTANIMPMKRTDTTLPIVENQEPKIKGKSKTEGLKSEVRQDKTISLSRTTQPNVGKDSSGNRLTQQKATVTNEHSKKTLQTTTRSSRMIASTEERGQDQAILTKPNGLNQQALILGPNLEGMVPAKKTLQTTTRTSQMIASTEEQGQDQVALTKPNAPIQQALILVPNLEGMVPAKKTLQMTTRTSQMIASTEGQSQDQVALTKPNGLNHQALILGPNLEGMVPAKKTLQTTSRTSQMSKSTKEWGEEQVALTKLNAPIQQPPVLGPNPERMVPAKVDSPRRSNTLLTERDQVCPENFKKDGVRLSVPESSPEQDTEGSLVKYIGVQDYFQGQVHEQVYLDQSSVPRSLSGSTKASMVFGWSTSFPQERVKTQIPGISPIVRNIEAEMGNIKALETTEIKMDVLVPPKTVQIVDGPLGLQWVPQLYSNYVQLGVVPGRQDQWDPHGRGTSAQEPIGRLPELCKPACKESLPKNQSTFKPLLDVRVGDLPVWLANRSYSPNRIPEFIKNAWGRYYNKYINVRKGGVGGLTMLLAGYCVLSYSWNYNHIKLDRWRKYH